MTTDSLTDDAYYRELIAAAHCGRCRQQPSTRAWKFQPQPGGPVLIAALCDLCADLIHADLRDRTNT
jgi:hypothetical protein